MRAGAAVKFLAAAYRFVSSRSVAVVLLLVLAGVAFVGSLVVQLSLAGAKWVLDGSTLHPLIRTLGLDDLFRARWVLVLAGALVVNLLLCSVNRLRRRFLRPHHIRGLLHFRQIVTAIPIEESRLLIEEELRLHRFRVHVRSRVGSALISARRNGFSLFSSLLFHLSLLLGMAGFVVRAQEGQDGELVLFPDQAEQVVPVPGETLQVQLVDCGTDYNLGPGSDNYVLRQRTSDLILYANRRFERAVPLRINHPVLAHRISLFQGDPVQLHVIRLRRLAGPGRRHGPSAGDTTIRVRENEPFKLGGERFMLGLARLGTVHTRLQARTRPAPWSWFFPRRDTVFGRLPVQSALFRLLPADSGRFTRRPVDTLRLERPLTIAVPEGAGHAEFTLSLLNIRQGTKIGYRYDPARVWFLAAGALFLVGILLRGLLPAYELHAAITEEEGETVVRIGGRALGLFTSLRPLVNEIVGKFEAE